MPKFELESINYIVTGQTQKILNLDFVQDGKSSKNVSFFTDTEAGTYDLSADNFRYDYVTNGGKNVNEFGFIFLSDPKNVVRTLYDVKDVALKSAVAERITNKKDVVSYKNTSVIGTDEDAKEKEDNGIEIYFPHSYEDPIGFVQVKHYSYGMTNKTVVGPVVQRTDIYERKNDVSADSFRDSGNAYIWNFYLNPYDKYNSTTHDPGQIPNLIPVFLYTPLENLKPIVSRYLSNEYDSMIHNPEISADTLSSISAMTEAYTSSYYSFLTFFRNEANVDFLSSLFKPVYNFSNINHNYIMEVPLKSLEGDNRYDLGLVKADIIMGKNTYDNLYNVNVETLGDFKRVRDYQTINAVGDKVFLTYFDDNAYNPNQNNANFDKKLNYETYNVSGTIDVEEENKTNYDNLQRDYMKIECIDAVNRFVSTTLHKANLYATKVCGLDNLLDDEKFDVESYRNNIKLDIENSIRRIVKNFTPAHTQYYGVVDWPKSDYRPEC